jgi:RNA polymerase sigma factor (sigma-70 family)
MSQSSNAKEMVLLDLIRQVGYGRKQSLRKFYDLTSRDLFVYLHRLLYGKKNVNEILIETYLEVKQSASQFDESCKVSLWIKSIARGQAMFIINSADNIASRNSIIDHEDQYKSLGNQQTLNNAMQKLAPDLREVLGLILMPKSTYNDVALLLNINERTARDQVIQALAELKKHTI